MTTSPLILTLALGCCGILSAATDPTTLEGYNCGACALRTASAPVLDGTIDAVWAEAPTHEIGTFVPQPTNNDLVPPNNTADLSGQFRALWDDENLYLLVEARDEALVLADFNSIEVYTSLAYTRQYGEWSLPGYCVDVCRDYQMQFQLKDNSFTFGLYSYKPDHHDLRGVAVATTDGYVAELVLPWAELDEAGLDRVLDDGRDYLGFELYLQDDDDGTTRDTKLAWCGGPEGSQYNMAWADTSLWGTLVLAEDSCAGGGATPGCANSVFRNPPAYDLGDCWKWNPVLGFLYDGFDPFVYLHDSAQWIFVFGPADLAAGFYLYNLTSGQFGYTTAAWIDGDGVDDLGIVLW